MSSKAIRMAESILGVKQSEMDPRLVKFITDMSNNCRRLGADIQSRQIVSLAVTTYDTFMTKEEPIYYAITRNIGDTTLNGREYLLDIEDKVVLFESSEDAGNFFIANGISIDTEDLEIVEYDGHKGVR